VGAPALVSIRLIVRGLTIEAPAKASMFQPNAALAHRIWIPVIVDISAIWPYLGHMAHKLKSKASDWQSHLLRLEGAYAPSTIRAYYDDVISFVDWCAAQGLESFPSNVETVCRFVEDQGRRLVPTTVRRRLVAIGKVHRLMGMFDPTRDEEVRLSLRRVIRSRKKPPQQARGLSRAQLGEVLSAQPETGWGLRDRAILALGFEMLGRRSEIAALRDSDLDWLPDGTLRVTIRRSKTDQAGMGRYVFTSRYAARVVAAWIAWRGRRFEFLFCPIYQGLAIRRELNAVTVRRAIQKGATLAGLDMASEFRGHSLRVGAAQELLCAGFDTVAIMRAGGWKSVATLARYLEFAEHNVWEAGRDV
jgi:integrase/recombinase XerD